MYYKYFGIERIGFFDDLKVRFSQLSALNDPFEVSAIIDSSDLLEDLLRDSKKKSTADWNRLPLSYRTEQREEEFRKKIKDEEKFIIETAAGHTIGRNIKSAIDHSAGVFCVTTEADNLLMWSHYSSNHRGFVIGMNPDHDFFHKKGPGFTFPIRKVSYSILRGVCRRTDGRDKSLGSLLYEKSLPWAYENEYRLVRGFRDIIPTPDFLKEPAIYMDLVKLPTDLIKKIYVGAHASPDLTTMAVSSVKKHGLTAEVIQLHIEKESYGLREERLV